MDTCSCWCTSDRKPTTELKITTAVFSDFRCFIWFHLWFVSSRSRICSFIAQDLKLVKQEEPVFIPKSTSEICALHFVLWQQQKSIKIFRLLVLRDSGTKRRDGEMHTAAIVLLKHLLKLRKMESFWQKLWKITCSRWYSKMCSARVVYDSQLLPQ